MTSGFLFLRRQVDSEQRKCQIRTIDLKHSKECHYRSSITWRIKPNDLWIYMMEELEMDRKIGYGMINSSPQHQLSKLCHHWHWISCSVKRWKMNSLTLRLRVGRQNWWGKFFFPHKANVILGLPINTALPNDALILTTAPIGKFSIRSDYKITIKFRDQSDSGSYSNDSDTKKFWKRLRGLNIPSKVEHFAWRAYKNSLPTLANLQCRGIVKSAICEPCGSGCESTGHVF